MPSDPRLIPGQASRKTTANARYFNGQSARSWQCEVRIGSGGLEIDRGNDDDLIIWPYSALSSSSGLSRKADEAIIEWREVAGAQVHVRDAAFVRQLVRLAPQLSSGGQRRRWLGPLLVLAAMIVAVIGLVWHLDLKPARAIAMLLPDSARQTLGRGVISQFEQKARTCYAPPGVAALEALKTRLLAGVPNADIFRVSVIDLPLVNAFAAPGGQMVITNKLIRSAKTPDEVAGILAHEIGHGIERHPEASVIRAMGLSFLFELMTGGSSGGMGSLGLMYLQTGYMRRDEFSADGQALRLLRDAKISQHGLADFFARAAEERCDTGGSPKEKEACRSSGSAEGVVGLLRTHPYPSARLKVVRKTPRYSHTPALTSAQWLALRQICRVSKSNKE